jgi:hypothetical protein
MAIRHSHAAWCARNGVIADDVTSEATRMHAEHTSEAPALSFCVSALPLTVRARPFVQLAEKSGKICKI